MSKRKGTDIESIRDRIDELEAKVEELEAEIKELKKSPPKKRRAAEGDYY